MFTINIYLKWALIAVCLLGGVALSINYGFWYASPLFLIGLVLLASYILLGTIQSASMMMQKMDFAGAEKRLSLSLKPDWLYVTNRAYYYLLKGSLAMQRNETDTAESWFERAQKLKLPSDNERAMILIQMINIHLSKNRIQQANNAFRELKKLNYSDEMFKEPIRQIEEALKQQGRMKMMGQVNPRMIYRPGGKRKMPRIR